MAEEESKEVIDEARETEEDLTTKGDETVEGKKGDVYSDEALKAYIIGSDGSSPEEDFLSDCSGDEDTDAMMLMQ